MGDHQQVNRLLEPVEPPERAQPDRQPASKGENEPAEHRTRVRRPTDLSLAAFACTVIALLFGVAHGLPIGTEELSDNVASWSLHHLPRVLALFSGVVVDSGCLVLVVLAVATILRSDRRDGVNALVASLGGAGVALAGVFEWQSRHGGVAGAILRGSSATALVVSIGFVAFMTGTDLTRRPRWRRWCLLAVAALLVSELTLRDLTFFAVLIAPITGWAIGLVVRWALTAASVRPSSHVLVTWLQNSGVAIATLAGRNDRSGLAGSLRDGTGVVVLLANRDNRGSGIARRLWHSLRLRGAATGAEMLSSRSQLEHQALASYLAAGAGVIAPRVLTLAEFPPETLVLALSAAAGSQLDEGISPTELAGLFAALRSLHRAGVAHRDLRAANLLFGSDGVGFSSMERAQTGAGELVRRLDVAQLLTTVARVVGASETVKAFREGYRPDDERAVAAILQPVALASWGWSAMRTAKGCLAEVRRELVGTDDTATPLRLERFRWRTVLSAVALSIAAFLLVGQFSKVNLLGALRAMNPAWFAVAIGGSALTYFGAALNLAAFVPKQLSLVRGFCVQLSSAFVGIAMPPTVGHIAVNSRYLHRQGLDEGAIAAAVAVSQIVNIVSSVVLLLVIGLLTGSGVSHLKIVPSTDVLIGLACVVIVIASLFAVPHARSLFLAYIWPHVRMVIPRLLEAISQPLRLAAGLSGNLLLTVGYVGALLAALLAFGAHPPVLATVAVYLAGNAVGSVAPTPGGLGAVEAVLSAGLHRDRHPRARGLSRRAAVPDRYLLAADPRRLAGVLAPAANWNALAAAGVSFGAYRSFWRGKVTSSRSR